MADSKESFETLEDGSGNGVSATASQSGDAGLAKIGMAVFPYVDTSGNLRQPRVNASNDLKVDGSGYTQPVSATALTDGSQKAQIVDGAGDIADVKLLSAAVVSTDKGIVSNTVIHGQSSASPGTYIDVKVTPSGSLTTDTKISDISAVVGQQTMANSLPVTIASNQTEVKSSLGKKKTFIYNTGPLTGATATGTKSLAYVFHPSSLTTNCEFVSILVDQIAGKGGTQRIELRRITAENATPGGTSGTAVAKLSTDTTSITMRSLVTGAPTRVTQSLIGVNSDTSVSQSILLVGFGGIESLGITPWTAQASTAIGYEVTQEVVSTISSAPTFNITFEWTEV